MQADLGGAFYEMAIRDHVRLDVLTRKAAELQRVDAELLAVERVLELERADAAGLCPGCGAPYGHAVRFCAECGRSLVPTEAANEGAAESCSAGPRGCRHCSPGGALTFWSPPLWSPPPRSSPPRSPPRGQRAAGGSARPQPRLRQRPSSTGRPREPGRSHVARWGSPSGPHTDRPLPPGPRQPRRAAPHPKPAPEPPSAQPTPATPQAPPPKRVGSSMSSLSPSPAPATTRLLAPPQMPYLAGHCAPRASCYPGTRCSPRRRRQLDRGDQRSAAQPFDPGQLLDLLRISRQRHVR